MAYQGLIINYKNFLPVTKNTPVITLLEGNTPLIYSPKISKLLGNNFKVYLKYEGLNPTGSFKDRGMTVAISKAKEQGAKPLSARQPGILPLAAAYAARANLKCIVVIPEGRLPLGN